MDKIISFSDISRELIGEPITNGEALKLIQSEREAIYSDLQDFKSKGMYEDIRETLKLVMAYDILIESFEQYLGHNK